MADDAAGASAPAMNPQQPTTAPTAPATTAAVAAEAEPWKKVKHKVKIDRQEREVPYDELVAGFQLNHVSHARMKEAAEMRKSITDAWDTADPESFFKRKNLNAEQWAEELLLKKIRLQNMTPEQRRDFEEKQQEKAEREEFQRHKEKFEDEKRQALVDQVSEKLDVEFTSAFKEAGVHPDPVLVDLMARRMEIAFDQSEGKEQMPAAAALAETIAYLDGMVDRKFQHLSADDLRKKLPKKLLDDLRRQDVELVRSQSPMRSAGNGASQPSTPQPSRTLRRSTDDVFKDLEAKLSS